MNKKGARNLGFLVLLGAVPLAADPLPAPWDLRNAGTVTVPGTADYNVPTAGAYTITGSGSDIEGTSDHFVLVSQISTGTTNGVLVARLVSVQPVPGATNTTLGIMIRESTSGTTNNSRYAALLYEIDREIAPQWRLNSGNSHQEVPELEGFDLPLWYALRRNGTTVTALYSLNGTDWIQVNQTVFSALTSNARWGMVVCSYNNSVATSAVFDNVVLTTGLPVVSVAATDAAANETGDTATFTISRTGSTAAPLDVSYTMGGTAVMGEDYQPLSGVATIPAGQASVDVTVVPVDDSHRIEGLSETVSLTAQVSSPYVNVGAVSSASAVITEGNTSFLETASGEFRVYGGVKGYADFSKGDILAFSLVPPQSGAVRMRVYSMPEGRLVWDLQRSATAGVLDLFSWDGVSPEAGPLPSGVYMLHVEGAGIDVKKKIAFIR